MYKRGGQVRGAACAEVEHRRREFRGAAGTQWVGREEGCPLPGEGSVQSDDFWCILGTIFTI